MSNSEYLEKIEALQEEVEALKASAGKKDNWDKISVVGSLVMPFAVPLAVGWAGIYFSDAQKEAEIESASINAKKEVEIKEIEDRQYQSQVIAEFKKDLASDDPLKREIAMETILYAAPDEAPRLLSIIAQDSTQSEKMIDAGTKLQEREHEVIQQVVGPGLSASNVDADKAAANVLESWSFDDGFVTRVLEEALERIDNEAGVNNVLQILLNCEYEVFYENRNLVQEYLVKAYKHYGTSAPMEQTEQQADFESLYEKLKRVKGRLEQVKAGL